MSSNNGDAVTLVGAVLPIGAVFDTPYEHGCIVVGAPDAAGNFLVRDSDGVECYCSPVMVARVVSVPA